MYNPPSTLTRNAWPRIVVVQLGARRSYVVPIVFEQAGILEAFYTDVCAGRGLGRLAGFVSTIVPIDGIKGLANRRLPNAVLGKTRTFDGLHLDYALRLLWKRGVEARYRETLRYGAAFGRRISAMGIGEATHIYSTFGEGDVFLSYAKRAGLKIVTDVIIALSAEKITLEEHRAFPKWGDPPLDQRAIMGPAYQLAKIMLETTDLFICPSGFVQNDLVTNWGVNVHATRVVPYSVEQKWFMLQPKPEPGRVLFAGTADLRKGIHYFAMAADRLRSKGYRYQFRVLGHAAPAVRSQPVCNALTFVGKVLRSEMLEEFTRADVLVLPTLAEGSAGVTYEALASGVPVVTTRAAGSIVRDGIDGLIVPERDPDTLADAIERIVEDRQIRAIMANAGRSHIHEFTWDRYGARLIAAVMGEKPIDCLGAGQANASYSMSGNSAKALIIGDSAQFPNSS